MSAHRTNRRGRPHLPFYKDERILGGTITVSVSLRLLLISLGVFAVVMCFVALTLLDGIESNRRLSEQTRQTQEVNHANRLADQARTDAEVRQLACSLVAQAKSAAPGVDVLRKEYRCPAPAPTPKPAPTSTPAPSRTPDAAAPAPSTPDPATPAATPAPTAAAAGTLTHSQPRSSAPPPHPSAPPATTPAAPTPPRPTGVIGSLTCPILGFLC